MKFDIYNEYPIFSEEGMKKNLRNNGIGGLIAGVVVVVIGVVVSPFNIIIQRRSTSVRLEILLYILGGLAIIAGVVFIFISITAKEKLYHFHPDRIHVTLLEDQSDFATYTNLISVSREVTITSNPGEQPKLSAIQYTFVDQTGSFSFSPSIDRADILQICEQFDLYIASNYGVDVQVVQKTLTRKK